MAEVKTETKQKPITVSLDNRMSVNGVHYEEGDHDVSPELAEDLVRMNKDHNKYLADLNKNNKLNGNLGSRSAA